MGKIMPENLHLSFDDWSAPLPYASFGMLLVHHSLKDQTTGKKHFRTNSAGIFPVAIGRELPHQFPQNICPVIRCPDLSQVSVSEQFY